MALRGVYKKTGIVDNPVRFYYYKNLKKITLVDLSIKYFISLKKCRYRIIFGCIVSRIISTQFY